MKKPKIKLLTYQNYLAMIKNSPNTKMFRNIYVLENKKKKDILRDGNLSCAYFVSSILKIFDLISPSISPHATVEGTIKDMFQNGWQETKKLKPGNIVAWEEKECSDGPHLHLGFFLNKDKVISNSHKKRAPKIHHLTYGKDNQGKPKRRIIKIYTHKVIK